MNLTSGLCVLEHLETAQYCSFVDKKFQISIFLLSFSTGLKHLADRLRLLNLEMGCPAY